MIFDTLKNIKNYRNISKNIYLGLEYLSTLDKSVNLGTYELNSSVKVIVTSYCTSKKTDLIFEAHKNVIDIQYPIIGLERIMWSPIDSMKIVIPYDSNSDTTYYNKPSQQGRFIDIGNGYFAIMFPSDGHAPQLTSTKGQNIKKITVKVSI